MRFKGPITDKTFVKKKNKVRGLTLSDFAALILKLQVIRIM